MFRSWTNDQLVQWLKDRGVVVKGKKDKKHLVELGVASVQPGFSQQEIWRPMPKYIGITADPSVDWTVHLEQHGWAVVTIPGLPVDAYLAAIQTWLSSFCPLVLNDARTWQKKNAPYSLHGILKSYIGSEAWLWDLRERCAPLYAAIYGTSELLVSFDGANISLPGGEEKNWFHSDTMRGQMGEVCYQGVVNLLHNGPDNGGLCLIDSSHLRLADYYARRPGEGINWGRIDTEDPAFHGLPVYKICLLPGQVAVWNSKVVHCAVPPKSGLRVAAYVSMRPKREATPKDLADRVKWYESGRMTNHCGFGPYGKVESVHPWVHGRPKNPAPTHINVAPLNARQCELVGYPSSVTSTPGKIIPV